jgi:ABC-type multidrug transport system fused ATPase/permease subunit
MVSRNSSGFWSSLAQLFGPIQAGRRGEIVFLVLLTVAGALTEVVTIGAVVPFLALLAGSSDRYIRWVQPLFDAIGADTREQALVAATALLCVAAVGAGILRVLLVRKTQDFVFSFGHRLSVEVQRRMLLQPYPWHMAHNSSEQLATIEKVEIVTSAVLLPLIQALAATILVVVVLVVLLQIAPLVTLFAALLLGAVYYALGAFARGRLEAYSGKIDSAFEDRVRTLQEGLGGVRDIILDGSQARVLDQFRAADLELAQARANTVFVSTIPRFLIEPVGIIVIAGLALFLSVRTGGLVAALPVLGALALGAQRLLPLIQQLYHGWSMVAANRYVIDDVAERLRLPIPAATPKTPRLPFERSIVFRDVGFTYFDRSHPAVAGLSFEIIHGSCVALVGPTGSGKSTTADLLMGLLEPTEGTILIDGAVMDQRNRQAWRANIAHVPQMLFLADTTIARNIALAADDETVDVPRIIKAAEVAQLDDFVAQLPQGYDTVVGERGVRLSGGQRQRLGIARAVYKQAPLLIFDEATSALDEATEAAVMDALAALRQKGRTIVIIAHRASTIARCDMVMRLRSGRLAEIRSESEPAA